jgi:hypothetical protein
MHGTDEMDEMNASEDEVQSQWVVDDYNGHQQQVVAANEAEVLPKLEPEPPLVVLSDTDSSEEEVQEEEAEAAATEDEPQVAVETGGESDSDDEQEVASNQTSED